MQYIHQVQKSNYTNDDTMKGLPTVKTFCHLESLLSSRVPLQRITVIFPGILYAWDTINISINTNIQVCLDSYQVDFRKQYDEHCSKPHWNDVSLLKSHKSQKILFLFNSIVQRSTNLNGQRDTSQAYKPFGLCHTTAA